MEKYPNLKNSQFTVYFLDRNTGIILNVDLIYYQEGTNQKVYTIHNSLKKAIEYAESIRTNFSNGNINLGYYIKDKNENIVAHTDNLSKDFGGHRLTIIIDGNRFSNEQGFYEEIDKVLTSDLGWKTGHNLNALNDLFRGGFGVHDYEEQIQIVWNNSAKSKKDLQKRWGNNSFYESIVDLIKTHAHIKFTEN